MVYYSMQQYVKNIENNISLRTIDYINCLPSKYEETKEKLEQLEHVDMVVEMEERHVYTEQYCEQLKSETYSGQTSLAPINVKTCPEVIEGRKITEEDKYVLIVPDKILDRNNSIFEFDNIVIQQKNMEEQYINGITLLGKNLTIKFRNNEKTTEKTFTIIGVFDSEIYSDKTNFYIPKSIIKEINKEIEYEFVDRFLKVVVDKLENVQSVYETIYSDENIEKTKIEVEVEAKENENSNDVVEQNISKVIDINLDTQNLIKYICTYFMVGIIYYF